MTVKEMIEMYTQNSASSLSERIEKGRTLLFNFDYPIFDSNYKKIFETHFIRNFFMREIGFETEGLFKFQLETWLLINMPYFNKIFESELIKFDPLTNTKLDVTQKKNNDKTQTQNSETNGNSNGSSTQSNTGNLSDEHFERHLRSDTPDSRLNLTANDGEGVIEYASEITETKETDSKTSESTATQNSNDSTNVNSNVTGNFNETEDYIESRIGKVGDQSFSKMLNEYRSSLLRIEKTIFNEMIELFMLVY
jgi:hypothetical protein